MNHDQNEALQIMPDIEEVKHVVFSLSPHSAVGPDGLNGRFFQTCWNIIKLELLDIVRAFFYGQTLPKYFTHAYQILLPKINNPRKLSEYRPIS